MLRLGIFIVSWNRPTLLRQTLDSLFGQLDVPATVTVIDNASAPEVRAWLAAEPRVHVYQLATNRWVNGAHEAAWPADLTRHFDLVLCSDNDVQFRLPLSLACQLLDEQRGYSLVSLQHSPEHPAIRETTWRGRRVVEKQSERGTALLCRARFLQENRPLPTDRHLDFDWWLCRDAPRSVARRGEMVAVLVGAAWHLGWARGDSTWQDMDIPEYAELRSPKR